MSQLIQYVGFLETAQKGPLGADADATKDRLKLVISSLVADISDKDLSIAGGNTNQAASPYLVELLAAEKSRREATG